MSPPEHHFLFWRRTRTAKLFLGTLVAAPPGWRPSGKPTPDDFKALFVTTNHPGFAPASALPGPTTFELLCYARIGLEKWKAKGKAASRQKSEKNWVRVLTGRWWSPFMFPVFRQGQLPGAFYLVSSILICVCGRISAIRLSKSSTYSLRSSRSVAFLRKKV